MPDSYLITGGAGFIGSNLAHALVNRGDQVRILDNFETGSRHNLAGIERDVELIEGDVRSAEACERAVRGMEFVLHHAANPSVPRSIEAPGLTHEVNATGTMNLLLAAKQ